MISYKWRGSLAFQCNCFLHSTDSPQVEKSRNVRCQLECQDSCKMELLQNIILQKKNTFLQKQISRTCLEVGLEESKRIFDSDKVWGVRQTILRGGVPKNCSCFPPTCSFKCPHKIPAWDFCSTFALRTFVWLFSTVCFQMCPQIACHWGCKVALVAFVWLFPMCVF